MIARRARTASLLALGALAVHQLRYALAYGDGAPHALAHQGHAYLGETVPVMIPFALAVLLAALIVPALRRIGAEDRGPRSLPALTVLFAAALLAMFAVQELIEGAVAAGHPAGAAAVLAHGGWLSIPLALALGALCALASMFLERAERALAAPDRRTPPVRLRPSTATLPAPAKSRAPLASLPLAFGLTRRGPPPLLPFA